MNIGDRHHLGSTLRGRCIESAARNLYRRPNQIVEPWPLQFVSNVRRYIGQQKMPITPRMVLTENAMQRQLHPAGGRLQVGLAPKLEGVNSAAMACGDEFCGETWIAKLRALPGSRRATRAPAGLRTSAAPPCAATLR